MPDLETLVAERWLYNTLSLDATLSGLVNGFFTELIPDHIVEASRDNEKYVVWSLRNARDVRALSAILIMSRLTYQVQVVAASQSGTALSVIAARINQLLDGQSGTATGGTIVCCFREQPVGFIENWEGKVYRHLGGTYRIDVQTT